MITRGATSWASIPVEPMSCQRSAIVSPSEQCIKPPDASGGEPLQLLLRMLVVLRWRYSSMFGNGEWEVVSLFGCLRVELFAGVISPRGGRCQGCL